MSVPTTTLASGRTCSRVIRGGWQLAGGHGPVERDRAIADMAAFVEAGVSTFDCADIYTGVEEMIGDFRVARPDLASRLRVHTKYVPDLSALATLTAADVRATIQRSLHRLRTERLDLVQFHWWDLSTPGMERIALALRGLRDEGLVGLVGGTNFDTPSTRRLLDAGVPLATMQVQYSLLDRRPENALAALCAESGMQLLCYGTLAGGFLSERWLGVTEPARDHANRSLVKYHLIIDEFGGWDLFQDLLAALKRVADRHDVGIGAVATAWVLGRPHVAAAIVGARYADHLPATLDAARIVLGAADLAEIDAVLARARGAGGDTYTLERDRSGPHGRIMKYELNRA